MLGFSDQSCQGIKTNGRHVFCTVRIVPCTTLLCCSSFREAGHQGLQLWNGAFTVSLEKRRKQIPYLFSFTTQQHCQWLAACKLPKRLCHIRNPVKRRLGTRLNRKRSRKMLWEADTWQRWRSHHESSDWLGRWRSQLLCSWGCSLLRGGISSHQTSCQVGKIMETWIRNVN